MLFYALLYYQKHASNISNMNDIPPDSYKERYSIESDTTSDTIRAASDLVEFMLRNKEKASDDEPATAPEKEPMQFADSIIRNERGEIEKRIKYDENNEIAYLETYENNGISTISNYKRGVLTGPLMVYNSTGYPVSRSTFYQGKLHGPFVAFGEYGSVIMICHYQNGIREGISITYGASGEIIESGQYIGGYKEGEFIQKYGDQIVITRYAGGVEQIKLAQPSKETLVQ
jgi:antitoxin component YwqK of YwqJK toxin-antitoxin module